MQLGGSLLVCMEMSCRRLVEILKRYVSVMRNTQWELHYDMKAVVFIELYHNLCCKGVILPTIMVRAVELV